MIGETIAERYHIEALIGRGGMGTVYRATDQIENRIVALKALHVFLDDAETALTRFHREFRVLARLDHPHIMRAYEYGTYKDAPYLILEFLEGHTLAEELTSGPLARDRMLRIACQLCGALGYLHSQSIVHRDLKPGNLMLLAADAEMQLKLMDFGLVRLTDLSVQLTKEGISFGTVAYMAPEQAQGLPVDFRADLYALGVLLYEMGTGRPPFVHDNPAVMLMQQMTTPPAPPRQLNPELDEPLEQLILQLLSKEAARRATGTDQIAARLAELANETVPVIASPAGRVDLIPHIPLIGRETALTQIGQQWNRARTGQGTSVVLVEGAAGVGKSRLLTEASLQVQLANGRFLKTNCREQGSLPYQSLIELFDALLDDLPPASRDALPPELGRLLPRLANTDPSENGTSSDQAEARLRLFAACSELLQRAAQVKPLLLALDDAQWADCSTLELLGYLADRLASVPILLILSYRPEEIEPEGPLDMLRRDLSRQGLADTIWLEPLNRAQVADFLRAAVPDAEAPGETNVPDWLIDSFHLVTGGNPLFIEETLKALAAEGQVHAWTRPSTSDSLSTSQPNVVLQLPQNVLALAERRLQALSDGDRSILTAAAVLGLEFSFSPLQGVTNVTEEELLDAIDRLLVARLIVELPLQGGEDRYCFAQEALRQALLNSISGRRRRGLHRRAGETLRAIYDTDQPRHWPILAHHFAESGESKLAFKYFTLAGDAAAQVYANVEAVAHYSRALEMLDFGSAPDEVASVEQLRHVFTQRGRYLELVSQFEEAARNYDQMRSLARQWGDQALELASLLAEAPIRAIRSSIQDLALAESLAQQALTLAQELSDREAEAKALWNLLLVNKNTERDAQAITYGEQALVIARKLNLREPLAFILNDISWAYLANGQPERTRASLREARALWRELGNTPMLADNLYSSAGHYLMSGEIEEAAGLAEEAIEISRPIENLWAQAHSSSIIGYIHLLTGRLDQAIEMMAETMRLSKQAQLAHLLVSTQADLGWMHGMLGAVERGLKLAEDALTNLQDSHPGSRSYAMAMLTKLHLLNGNVAVAEATLQESHVGLDMDETNSIEVIWVALAEADVALARQDYERVHTSIDPILARLRQLGIRLFVAEALLGKGQAFLAQGRIDEARRVLSEARSEAEALNLRLSLGPVLITLYQLESEHGQPDEANALRRQARETITYLAGHLPPDLRRSFLALSEVREITGD